MGVQCYHIQRRALYSTPFALVKRMAGKQWTGPCKVNSLGNFRFEKFKKGGKLFPFASSGPKMKIVASHPAETLWAALDSLATPALAI